MTLGTRRLPRAGFEVELLAPVGMSRLDLAQDVAERCKGSVRRRFHVDTEGSATPGVSAFWHLTPAFVVVGADGHLVASLVDDTTIVADLDAHAAPRKGWYRVLSDDPRLLRLVQRHADPATGIASVLDAVADLFGSRVRQLGAVHRLDDLTGATIAMAAPLPGERERPCEIVTPPLHIGHEERLETLLEPARDLGFTAPLEAAVHVHLDADLFRNVGHFRHLVQTFATRRTDLHALFGTNPHCRRLAPLPPALVELVQRDWRDWTSLREAASRTAVTKFCDVNLTRVLGTRSGPDTVEVRILAPAVDARTIVEQFAQLVDLLELPKPHVGLGAAP